MSEAYPLGRAAALKALELDDTLGEAHNSLAAITADYYWDWAEAERHFKRAVELNPNYETALRFYSSYLACWGGTRRRSRSPRARATGPGVTGRTDNLGVVHYFARRYDDAITAVSRDARSRSASALPTSCWDGCMLPKACPIEPSKNSSAPGLS